MPIDRSMMQLVLGLAGLQQQRQAQDLEERKFGQSQKSFNEMVKQFAHEHEDKDFAEAMTSISKLAPEQQKAFMQLQRSRTVQQSPDFLKALESFGVASPLSRGIASMNPQQRQSAEQEGATRAMTGGEGAGALGTSQMQGQLANDAMAGRVDPKTGQPSSDWMGFANNFLAQNAQGYTPEQMAVQRGHLAVAQAGIPIAQQNANTAQGGVEADWERVRLARKQLEEELAVGKFMAAAQKGQILTPQQQGEMRVAMGNILNSMKDPKSSKEDNLARIQLYNELANLVQSQAVIPTGAIGDPNSAFVRFLRSQNIISAPMPNVGPGFTPQTFTPSSTGTGVIRK